MTETEFFRAPCVERELAHGRRLVQPVTASVPTHLSGSAPMIWDLLVEHHTVEGIVAMLQQHFSDPPAVISAGVEAALASFLQSSLLVEP